MGSAPSDISQAPPDCDQANAVVSGTFTGTGQSATFGCWGPFNLLLYGSSGPNGNWVATVRLERTFDGGTTWIVCGIGGDGTQATWIGNNADISVIAAEPEKGVAYRLNCTAHTSDVNYRMSTTGQAALSLAVAATI